MLLICLGGLGLDFVFMAFAPTLMWLLVGRLISGATSGVFSTANAYVGVQSFLVRPVIGRFGEQGAMLAGAAAAVVAFCWYGLAPVGWAYLACMPISCLAGLMNPGLQGLMTKLVGADEQGQLQGANQSMAGLSSVIGPSLFGLSFAWAIRHPDLGLPGLPLLIAAAITSGCVVIGIRLRGQPGAAFSFRSRQGMDVDLNHHNSDPGSATS